MPLAILSCLLSGLLTVAACDDRSAEVGGDCRSSDTCDEEPGRLPEQVEDCEDGQDCANRAGAEESGPPVPGSDCASTDSCDRAATVEEEAPTPSR